ncbi:MAG: GAF domain-containing protein, partial [Armatimonadetes bacterium]|nr:GAF domain-containing protein [Armatimonadota bacterium]
EAPLAVSWQRDIYPSLWSEIIRLADDLPPGALHVSGGRAELGDRSFRISAAGEVMVNYRGGYQDFPRVAYHSLMAMSPEQFAAAVKNRIVLVGVDRPDLTRYYRTPTAPQMPGVEVAANVTDNLLAGDVLARPASWVRYATALLLTLLTAWLLMRTGPLSGLFITLLLLAGTILVGAGLFVLSVYVPMAEAVLAVGLTGAVLVADAAAGVDRRRVEAEARLQSRLQTIAGINRLTSSSLDRDQLLIETLRWAEAEIGAEACSLLLMDEGGRHLRFEVALGEKGPMLKDFRIEVGKGIAGTVAASAEPLVVDDVRRDPRWAGDIADAIEFTTRSILCVPMILQDQVVGVIELINKRGGTFNDQDVQLAQVIAHQAALFLERARLYRELEQRVDYANAELRDANRRLALEMNRIAALVDQMADGVIATDGRDRIVILNDVAERMFDLDADNAVGNPVLAVVDHPDLVSLFAMPLSPHGGSYETEIVLDEETGRTLMARIALVEQAGEEAVGKCAVFTDITHLKQLDQMKMDLISFVSHELKNPIASLQGACQMLEERLEVEDEHTARLLSIARRQGRRMQYLVQDFLDLSRIEAGLQLDLSWSPIDDAEGLIEGVFQLCRHGGSEHERIIEVAGDMPVFWADKPKLESVLINLVENAHKYSPGGGRITVAAFPRDGQIVFEVRDEGIGIREADISKLFRSFERVHDPAHGKVSGTGVGLYVCKNIVEAHGGRIEVESTWGEGSTFRIVLPHYTAGPGEEGGPAVREA